MSTYNHQQSYPGSTVNNTQSTMGSEAHRQYLASLRRRAPPPRFRPPMIIFMVLMGGLVFIGLVMTIIAVWPGYTPVGGNPLKIAGPILLAFGGAGFIIGMVLICKRSQEEKKDFARSFYAASSQRSLARSQTNVTPTPSMDAKPGKGILKNPSTSTYNGGIGQEGSDSGMPGTQSFSTNRSYEPDSDISDSSSPPAMGRVPPVSLNPDPTAAYNQRGYKPSRYSGGPVDHSSSTESEQAVMAHMPPQAPQKQSASYQNQAYAQETDIDADIGPTGLMSGPRATSTGRREMQDYSAGGFDAYDTGSARHTPVQQPPQQQRRWGQNRPQTHTPQQQGGISNDAYVRDTGAGVSTVSAQYSQYTTPQPNRENYQYSPNPSSSVEPAAGINTSSVSTEV